MPSQQETMLRHAKRFLAVLEEINQRDHLDDAQRGNCLNQLETLWLQIDQARIWAAKHSHSDDNAKRIANAFEKAGVEIAEIQAETRIALTRLKESLAGPARW